MIDVTELLFDPDFTTDFVVKRITGEFKDGRFILNKPEKLKFRHPVHPATEKELKQLPEGDQKSEVFCFFCVKPKKFHMTRNNNELENDEGGISDIIEYQGNEYKIIKVKDWTSHGWMRGFGALIGPVRKD